MKMSRVTFNRKRVKLKKLLGIRARLALLALILVAPLMLERVRSLEDNRAKQVALASQEFLKLAQHSADAQREMISSIETVLKSTAYIRASVGVGRSCDILRASGQRKKDEQDGDDGGQSPTRCGHGVGDPAGEPRVLWAMVLRRRGRFGSFPERVFPGRSLRRGSLPGRARLGGC